MLVELNYDEVAVAVTEALRIRMNLSSEMPIFIELAIIGEQDRKGRVVDMDSLDIVATLTWDDVDPKFATREPV